MVLRIIALSLAMVISDINWISLSHFEDSLSFLRNSIRLETTLTTTLNHFLNCFRWFLLDSSTFFFDIFNLFCNCSNQLIGCSCSVQRKSEDRRDVCLQAQERLHPDCARRPDRYTSHGDVSVMRHNPSCNMLAEDCKAHPDCKYVDSSNIIQSLKACEKNW